MTMTIIPLWLTQPNLGSFAQSTSFYLNPIIIGFDTDAGGTVVLLNGALPVGLYWEQTSSTQISIFGVNSNLTQTTLFEFTFRIISSTGLFADRTYSLTMDVSIPAPTWDNQVSFLGYESVNQTSYFTVVANTTTTYPIEYSLPSPTIGQSINSVTGNLTVNYTGNVSLSVNVPVTIRANTTVTGTSISSVNDFDATYTVLASNAAPGWITPAGVIVTVTPGEYVEYLFRAFSNTNLPCTYSWYGNTQPGGYTLTNEGLLSGVAPSIDSTQMFEITATNSNNSNNSTTQGQTIVITGAGGITLSFITPDVDLGTVTDGEFYTYALEAISSSHNILTYSVTGGWLPNSLTLNPQSGVIQGFIDYNVIPHTYYWQISVTDGTNIASQNFTMIVNPKYPAQYATMVLPVTGKLKQSIIIDTLQGISKLPQVNSPELVLIDGLNYVNNIGDLLTPVAPWLHTQRLLIGNVEVITQPSNSAVIFRNIVDLEGGAATIQTELPGGTSWPQSLQNLRSGWSESVGFISSGTGTGASFQAVVDLETNKLSRVNVLNPGSGYYYPPNIIVSGNGSNATVADTLGVVSCIVNSSSNNWVNGSNVAVDVGLYNTPAEIQVTALNSNGTVQTIQLISAGSYSQAPTLSKELTLGNATITVTPSWGITAVDVIQPGSNYLSNTAVSVNGTEFLPSWQTTWSPVLDLAEIKSYQPYSIPDTIQGTMWNTDSLKINAQGKTWQGMTTLDIDRTMFDGGQCSYHTWLQPTYTIWDNEDTTWDNDLTIWDQQQQPVGNTYTYMQTEIDENTTWDQLYNDIYDRSEPWTISDTLISWNVDMADNPAGPNYVSLEAITGDAAVPT